MSRGVLIRLLLVLGLLGACVAVSLNKEPRLGLDLSGGTQIVLQTQDTDRVKADAESTDRALEILRGRVDALGVTEPTLTRSGSDQIIVELPDVQDPREAADTLGRTAQLSAHAVYGPAQSKKLTPEMKKKGHIVLPGDDGQLYELGPVVLDGNEITNASAQQPQNQAAWVVQVDFTGKGDDAFAKLSGDVACAKDGIQTLAFVLDKEIISNASVAQEFCPGGIRGGTSIESFPFEEADELATLIKGGALPVPVKVISQSIVGPTLGEAAIDASWKAGVIGLILTALFIGFVYRLFGFIATVALTSYALLSYAMLVALGSTLTLPGLAGFVLAIGLAIDANVLVFERAREEYADNPGAGLRRALSVGFNKAWTAIIDSNVTTLLAAGLLFFLGSGPIKGFGVTLTIGVVASMISALIIARVLTEATASTTFIAKRPKITGIANVGRVRTYLERKRPDILSRRKLWLAISAVALVIACLGIFVKGLNLGVEFTGGRVMEFTTTQKIDADTAREAVSDAGYPEATVQEVDNGQISVKVGEISDDEALKIQDSISDVSGGDAVKEEDSKIAASLGESLRDKALIAFGIAFLAQLIYLAFRFKWTFGLSAVIAMAHDVIIVVGLFAWLGKPIDGVFLAAAMTIIGLSVNDTVVVFDRIRERWYSSRDEKFTDLANLAAVETMPRTVNTGLGAMFILAALAVLGGDSLRDFSIALLVGLIVGTYSSVFTATPLVTYMQQKWPLSRSAKVKAQRAPDDSGAVV